MLILVVSECIHDAWARTQTIMDAFLERAGSRTWRGRLTKDGLSRLRDELSAAASRNTAVAASSVLGRRRFELEWIVGSSRPFGRDGQRVTYGGHAYDKYFEHRPPPAALTSTLSAIVELAGLWHDVGKANAEFQEKMRGNHHSADTVRHEILSNLAFTATMRRLGVQWAHASGEQICTAMREVFPDVGHFVSISQTVDLTPIDLPMPLRLAAWLIATHHRLPQTDLPAPGQSIADEGLFTLQEHANREKLANPRKITLDLGIIDPDLAQAMAVTGRKLGAALENAELAAALDFGTPSVLGRLALILSDRYVSRRPFDMNWHQAGRPEASALLANWETGSGIPGLDADLAERRRPKQALSEHLQQVGQYGPVALDDALDLRDLGMSLPSSGLPRALRGRSPKAYDWQNKAVDCVTAGRRTDAGFFAEVMAGTGAGKTRACPKILAAADSDLRYTLCLPLRSLTLQAGTDYRNDLDLGQADVATVIGSAAVRDLYDRRDRDNGSESATHGTGLLMDEVENKGSLKGKLPAGLWKHIDEEYGAARFLATPIVVSTVDQMMAVADARRTSYLVPALRLLSADVILDEIDSYGAEDQVAIGRLIYLAGLLGRKVVLSSATTLSPHANGLFAAYSRGYAAYCRFAGKPFAIDVGWFADSGQEAVLVPGESPGDYALKSHEFRASMVAALATRAPLRIAEILARPEVQGVEAFFGMAESALAKLHDDRHSVDRRTRKNVSVLLVRFAHIRSCVRFSHWLADRQSGQQGPLAGKSLKILPYHSNFPLLMRDRIEVFLDGALKRSGRDNFLDHRRVRTWLQSSSANDNVLVVVTTSVEEIGRDHDFDGLVIEPSSEHSIIQCAGRIERHRHRAVENPNIFVLPTTMRVMRGQSQRPYSRPGPEGQSTALNENYQLTSPWFSEISAFATHPVVDARCRLLEEGYSPMAELTGLEHRIMRDHMVSAMPYSLRGFTDPQGHFWLARNHADTMRFRRGAGSALIWYDPTTEVFVQIDDNNRERSIGETLRHNSAMTLGPCRFLDLDPKTVLFEEQDHYPHLEDTVERRAFARKYLQVSLPVYGDGALGEHFYAPDFGIFAAT